VRFLIDSMLPPRVAELLVAAGHDATTPTQLGAHNLPDDVLVQLAGDRDRERQRLRCYHRLPGSTGPQGLVAGRVTGTDALARAGPMGERERRAGALGTLASC
jgi:Domain of unknown function (DUF5615)